MVFYFFHEISFYSSISGVADGVGGWRSYGIDPGEFSSFLMRTCERLVGCSTFNPERPVSLLAYSYCELLEQKKPILGKSHAREVIAVLQRLIFLNHGRNSLIVITWPQSCESTQLTPSRLIGSFQSQIRSTRDRVYCFWLDSTLTSKAHGWVGGPKMTFGSIPLFGHLHHVHYFGNSISEGKCTRQLRNNIQIGSVRFNKSDWRRRASHNCVGRCFVHHMMPLWHRASRIWEKSDFALI